MQSQVDSPFLARLGRSNQSGGRLSWQSSSIIQFARFCGEVIEVGDEIVAIPSGSPYTCNKSANLIASDGTDAGSAPVANTSYGVFLSNSRAVLAAGTPTLRIAAGDFGTRGPSGQFYLGGGVGDGANWRAVGAIRMDGSTNFVDSLAQRFVINRDNLIARTLLATPGYNDNNAQTTVVISATNYAPINAGTGDFVEWIADGINLVQLEMHVPILSGGVGASLWGIGINSTTTARASGVVAATAANVNAIAFAQTALTDGVMGDKIKASMLAANTGAGATFYADFARNGSSADPIAARLGAILWC